MFNCELCNRSFDFLRQLACHLSNYKSTCKTNVKDYYDKYLKKEDEGFCWNCGRETGFGGIITGYSNSCNECKNYNPESKEKSLKSWDKRREISKINSGYYNLKEICELCKKRFENRSGLSHHISQVHKIEITCKDYYDKYLKKEGEGICPVTGEETKFIGITKGYNTYRDIYVIHKDEKIKKIIREICIEKFGFPNAMQNPDIKKKAEETNEKRFGVKHVLQCPEIKKKAEDSMEKRLGFKISFHSPIVKQKIEITNIKKYGVKYTGASPIIQKKIEASNEKKYGFKYTFQVPEIKKKIEDFFESNYGVKNPSQVPHIMAKIIKKISGSNHYNWIEDRSIVYGPYTQKFYDKNYRKQILKDQNFLDPISGEKIIIRAALHHIDYDKKNDSRDNLIYLNLSSHIKTNSNRQYWQELLTKINLEIVYPDSITDLD